MRFRVHKRVLALGLAVVVGLLLLAPVHAHDSGGWESDCGICSLAKCCPIPVSVAVLATPVWIPAARIEISTPSFSHRPSPTPFEPRAPPADLNQRL